MNKWIIKSGTLAHLHQSEAQHLLQSSGVHLGSGPAANWLLPGAFRWCWSSSGSQHREQSTQWLWQMFLVALQFGLFLTLSGFLPMTVQWCQHCCSSASWAVVQSASVEGLRSLNLVLVTPILALVRFLGRGVGWGEGTSAFKLCRVFCLKNTVWVFCQSADLPLRSCRDSRDEMKEGILVKLPLYWFFS